MIRFIMLYPQKDPVSLITAIERKSKTLAMALDEPEIAEKNTQKVAEALNRWSNKNGATPPVPNDKSQPQDLKSQVIATLLECGPILEKGQLCDRLVDDIINSGFPDVPAFKEQMKRSLMNSREGNFKDPEALAEFCFKQANRFERFITPAPDKEKCNEDEKSAPEETCSIQRRTI